MGRILKMKTFAKRILIFLICLLVFPQICSFSYPDIDGTHISSGLRFIRALYSNTIEMFDETAQKLTVGDRTYYSGKAEFQNYEELKTNMLKSVTPYMGMILLGNFMGNIYNINGETYVLSLEGSMTLNLDELMVIYFDSYSDSYIKLLGYDVWADGSIYSTVYGLEKKADSYRIDYIEDYLGEYPTTRSTTETERYFNNYIHNIIVGYILSENINCGYEKFSHSLATAENTSLEISVDSFDAEDCTGKAHAIIDEYDENGNVISQHKIVVEIGENLSEKVTDIDLSNGNPDTSDVDLVFIVLAVAFGAAGLFLLSRKIKARQS